MFCKAFVVVVRISFQITGRAKEKLWGSAVVTYGNTTKIIILYNKLMYLDWENIEFIKNTGLIMEGIVDLKDHSTNPLFKLKL